MVDASRGSDMAIMLYTSGTTGQPKGVVHTFDSMIHTARGAAGLEGLTDREEVLAYLPMAWVGDNLFSFAQSLVCGFCVSCPESSETVMTDMREIGPTYYFAPPRVFENLLTQVTIRMEDAGRIKRWLFRYFMAHARRVGVRIVDGETVGFWDRLGYRLGDWLVYGPVKNVLGFSRIRLVYTAGEAIGPELFAFYRALNINIKQLYGSTEAYVMVCVQPNGEVKSDSVGRPAPGVEVQLDDSGEVLFRGERISGLGARKIAQRGVSRTFQHVKMVPDMTVLENVALGTHLRSHSGAAKAMLRLDRAEERSLFAEAERQLRRVGMGELLHHKAGDLAMGQQRLLEIARALCADPALLLLDEPAAGLRHKEKQELANVLRTLRSEGMAILLVEHDMGLVMDICDHIVVMEFGTHLMEGTPAEVQSSEKVRAAYLGTEH